MIGTFLPLKAFELNQKTQVRRRIDSFNSIHFHLARQIRGNHLFYGGVGWRWWWWMGKPDRKRESTEDSGLKIIEKLNIPFETETFHCSTLILN